MAAMEAAAAANPSELDIVLFNVSGKTQSQKDNIYTDLNNYRMPLFILCLDKFSPNKHKKLCSELMNPLHRENGEVSIHCHCSEEYTISNVDEDTLETVKGGLTEDCGKYFTVARLMACVLKPADLGYGKILLVAWSGYGDDENPGHAEMTSDDKRKTLESLVCFVDRLKETEGCDVVVIGGDFNMSNKKTGNILKTLQPNGLVVPGNAEDEGADTEEPGNTGEEGGDTEEPGNAGEEGRDTEEPGNTGEEGGDTGEPGNTGEEGGDTGEPGNTGEEGGDTEEPGNTGEEGRDTEEPGNTGEEGRDMEEPGNTGEEGGDTEEPGNTGEEGRDTEEPGNTGEEGRDTEEPGNTGEEGRDMEEPGNTGEEGGDTEEPGNTGEEGRDMEEPGNTGEEGRDMEEPGNTGEEGTQGQHNRNAIIYWPKNKLEYDTMVIDRTNISRFKLQPTTGSEESLHPTLGIALIPGQRKVNGQEAMRKVLDEVKDSSNRSLFVLCQDGITGPRHKILCKKLRYDYRSCGQKEEAGVYYRHSEQYEVTYVEETMLDEKVCLSGVLDRLMVDHSTVRVLTPTDPSYPKVLLVSFHGLEAEKYPNYNISEESIFRKLVYCLDYLKYKEDCGMVVVGGNFNLRVDENAAILKNRKCKVLSRTEYGPNYIIYWPKDKLQESLPIQHTGERNSQLFYHDTLAYTFEVQPSRPTAAVKPGHPLLRILLFNLHIRDSEIRRQSTMAEEERRDAMLAVLHEVKDNYTGELVVLCQENIDQDKHRVLCEQLHDNPDWKEKAGVYCFHHDAARYSSEGNSALQFEETYLLSSFPLERLMACVLTPKDDSSNKLLLVSWHGPYKVTDKEKHDTFVNFVLLLTRLQDTENCQAVLAGGDFNLPSSKARELLVALKSGDADLKTYEPSASRTEDPIDYIIYWPKSNFQKVLKPEFVCPHFTIEKPQHPNRPFDHPIVAYRLQYTADSNSP